MSRMTVDPRFVLNPDLEAVPAARSASLEFDCRTVHNRSKAPRALVLADVSEGYVTPTGAAEIYKVVVIRDGTAWKVDEAATAARRRPRSSRGR